MNLNFQNLLLSFRTLWHFILFLPTTLKKELTMTAIHEPVNLGDLLKYEEGALRYSRDVAIVAAGQNLDLGCVVSRDTVSGKLKQLDPLASDGSETPVGILLVATDATLMDVEGALLLSRHAAVASSAVVWPAGISAADKASATSTLERLGIVIYQSA